MIYFCIPAYNEERTVGVVLWKLRQVMAELNRDYQIIVVDDASTDSTPTVLSPYIRVLPLTVIRSAQRHGYAASLELAIREAVKRAPYPKRDAIIVLQADFTEDLDVVAALVKKIEAGADVVTTDTAIQEDLPRGYRWGRRLLRWLARGRAWAQGDVLSGLRAYRVMVMKRALDTRGADRLLSWPGWGANAELLALVAPHSRRTEIIETTLKQHRHQRDTRFTFMETQRAVRGALGGKLNPAVPALPTDGIVATPLPIAAENVGPRRRPDAGRTRGRTSGRDRDRERSGRERGGRDRKAGRPARAEGGRAESQRSEKPDESRRTRGPRPDRVKPAAAEAETAVATDAPAPGGEKKKRRRPRRRKNKTQQSPQLVVEGSTAPAAGDAPAESAQVHAAEGGEGGAGGEQAKKKSRRGRRGGRGRRRGPRNADGGNSENNTAPEGGSEAAPPMAAEGD